MKKISIVAALVGLLFPPSLQGQIPWAEETTESVSYEYRIVASDGTVHTHQATYKGILASYQYQTGKGGVFDSRKCHWGFDRKLVRGERSIASPSGAEGPWISGQSRKIYSPNLFGRETSRLLATSSQILAATGISDWDGDDGLHERFLKSFSAILVASFKPGANCGEATSQIAKQASILKKTIEVAFLPTAIVDYFLHTKTLQEKWFYIDSEGERHAAMFVYPLLVDEAYRVVVAQEVRSAYAIFFGAHAPKELVVKYSNRWKESDWKEQFYHELGRTAATGMIEPETLASTVNGHLIIPSSMSKEQIVSLEQARLQALEMMSSTVSEKGLFAGGSLEPIVFRIIRRLPNGAGSYLEEFQVSPEEVIDKCHSGFFLNYSQNYIHESFESALVALRRNLGQVENQLASSMESQITNRILFVTLDPEIIAYLDKRATPAAEFILKAQKFLRLVDSRAHREYRKAIEKFVLKEQYEDSSWIH